MRVWKRTAPKRHHAVCGWTDNWTTGTGRRRDAVFVGQRQEKVLARVVSRDGSGREIFVAYYESGGGGPAKGYWHGQKQKLHEIQSDEGLPTEVRDLVRIVELGVTCGYLAQERAAA